MAGGKVISANPLNLDIYSHKKCLLICGVITMSSFQYGLDYAMVGGFMAMPGFLKVFGYYDEARRTWAIDPTVQQLISSLMTIGTFVGSLLVGPFSSKLGRRWGLWAASILNFLVTGVQLGTTNLGALYFSRFILGISVGWFLTFAQVYIGEVSPAHLRGVVFGVYQTQLSVGSVVGAAVNYGTSKLPGKEAYQIPLAVFFFAPTIQCIALFFFPESPRWLMTQGRQADAEASLRRLRNKNIDRDQFNAEFNVMKAATARETGHGGGKQMWLEQFKGVNFRRTWLSVAAICFHAANGSSWINIYKTYFLTVAAVPNQEAFSYTIMMTCLGLCGVIFSVFVVRHMDRRLIMMVGVAACGACQVAFAVAWTVAPGSVSAGKVTVAFMSIFNFVYVAYAPYAWLIGGEYPNNHLRAHTFGLGTALNFLGNWLGVFTAPYFINPASLNWSAKYGYIWAGSNAICFVFTWFFIPETRDRTLEEINEMFEANLPARKFKGYTCVGTAAMAFNEKDGSVAEVEDKSKQPEAKEVKDV